MSNNMVLSDKELLNELRQYLQYCPNTGVFTWIKVMNNIANLIGKEAGSSKSKSKRRYIKFNNKCYLAHRLAWLFTYGHMPDLFIDHIDRNPSNNRINNLRVVNNSENMQNQGTEKKNNTGFLGVDFHQGKYRARIKSNRKEILIGLYNSAKDASEAYLTKKRELHPFCTI